MSERIASNPFRFRCERPDHVGVFDEHCLASDYDALAADAARYRWLKTRINWRESVTHSAALTSGCRVWSHYDYREKRPDSESIDEYIDAALGATHE